MNSASATKDIKVDVKAFIDQRPMAAMQWLLLGLCFLIVALDGMDVAIMGFLAPSILQEWSVSRAAFGAVMSAAPFGLVIGAILVGWAMDKKAPTQVIGAAYAASAVCILALGLDGALSGSLTLLVTAAGFCMSGAQTGLNAFAPNCYPTVARATGVSWMPGMGRFGSITGSMVGGVLLSLGWGFGAIISLLAVPAILAGLAVQKARRAEEPGSTVSGKPALGSH